jgi:hypothetical protein
MSTNDAFTAALQLLDAQAPTKDVAVHPDEGGDLRRRAYLVPTLDGRRQFVHAAVVSDSIFGERLDIFSVGAREMPSDSGLLIGLLALSRDFRRARLCVFDARNPQLCVVASFVPDELAEPGTPVRMLHAVREVASIADSLERQLTGVDFD